MDTTPEPTLIRPTGTFSQREKEGIHLSQREKETSLHLSPGESTRSAGRGRTRSVRVRVRRRTQHNKPTPLAVDLLDFARQLRKNQSDAEQFLWSILRNRRLVSAKFRRQHPLPPYVLDFYCHSAKLAIELDGGQHNSDEGKAKDLRRNQFLSQQGINVLRFWNHEVLQETDAVLEAIARALKKRREEP